MRIVKKRHKWRSMIMKMEVSKGWKGRRINTIKVNKNRKCRRMITISQLLMRWFNTKNGGNFSLAPLYKCIKYHSVRCGFDGIYVLLLFPPLQVEGLITVPADKAVIEGMRLARMIVTDCIVHRVHPAFHFNKFKMNPVNQVIDGLGALLF
ncbi:unnamed protein product [Prunus brigantina]